MCCVCSVSIQNQQQNTHTQQYTSSYQSVLSCHQTSPLSAQGHALCSAPLLMGSVGQDTLCCVLGIDWLRLACFGGGYLARGIPVGSEGPPEVSQASLVAYTPQPVGVFIHVCVCVVLHKSHNHHQPRWHRLQSPLSLRVQAGWTHSHVRGCASTGIQHPLGQPDALFCGTLNATFGAFCVASVDCPNVTCCVLIHTTNPKRSA